MTKKKTTIKKVDSITIVKKESQDLKWYDYMCIYTGSLKPMNAVGIDRLADDIVDWARNDDDALKLSEFYLAKGIHGQTWYAWCKRFPRLQIAHDCAKEWIGIRREKGALKGKLSPQVVMYTMPFYDKQWEDETVRRAALKDVNSESKSSVTVLMNPIPNSDIVPERKGEDD
jgi:hypothetical protein